MQSETVIRVKEIFSFFYLAIPSNNITCMVQNWWLIVNYETEKGAYLSGM
jgi:hypothetical protein